MNEWQKRAPLAEAMKAYARTGALAFHTPGHKQGLGAHPMLRDIISEEGLREDVAVMSELDNLHHPDGCILEAEKMAAALWGADDALFMVNGTTGAIHTMLMSSLAPGDEVLIPRNAHRSVFSGLVLADARPIYLAPEVDDRLGIALGVSEATVRQALKEHPSAKAVVIVYPTYYGVATELAKIAEAVHEHGIPLLVDEAHGAHLRFSDELPPDAIECGADLVAQSTHKLLGSLTQTSMLFVKGDRVPRGKIRRTASTLATTSPNYLLMASLDISRLQMATEGAKRMSRLLKSVRTLRDGINSADGLWSFDRSITGKPGAASFDETKVTVQVAGLGLMGAEAAHILRWKYNLQPELADAYNVLFLFSMADTDEVAEKLLKNLREFALENKREAATIPHVSLAPHTTMHLTPREAFFAENEVVPFKKAVGRIAAEEVTFYPPGIPALSPGEEITPELLDYLKNLALLGLKVTGPEDTKLNFLRVVK